MSVSVLADGLIADPRAAAMIELRYLGEPRMAAGTLQRWTLRCTARVDLPAGARIAVAHRWPNDWGVAQADDPAAADYLCIDTSSRVPVRWWTARLHTWHPFDHVLFVELPDGLARRECVDLHYGDAKSGSPGFHVQSFIEEASPFSLRWQAADGGPWVEFARHAISVEGTQPACLVVTVPSRVRAGTPISVHLRVEDRWGNPAALDEPVELAGPMAAQLVTVPASGWLRVSMIAPGVGIHRIAATARGASGLSALSNPMEVCGDDAGSPLFWGDLHGQSIIGCGARTIDAYFAHARDFAGTDVGSHQANCFLVTNAEWEETQASTRRQQQPGRFVTLLGVEWSGASSVGGDHNLYFPGDESPLRRCSHEFIADKSDADSDLRTVEDVYRHYRGSDTLVAVHVGGRTADLKYHEPGLDRLVEVHSTHATSEWFLFDALRRGYRMGVIAGSDGVDGRPGNSHPGHMGVRNVRGGLTAISAPELTRAAIWNALKARHCYATTGERILLELRAGSARMGDVLVQDGPLPEFEVRVEGTAPLERVDFFRGTTCLRSVDLFAAAGPFSNRVRIGWRGLSAPGNWQRARMRWDGALRVDGAQVVEARGWAFDTPDEGIQSHDASRVTWRSVTAGDWDGVEIELDHPDAAQLTFVTAPMTVSVRLAQVPPEGRRFEARNPERCLEIRRLPERAPSCGFAGRFSDEEAVGGARAYWVRVRQADGAYAWSTPIFVTAGDG